MVNSIMNYKRSSLIYVISNVTELFFVDVSLYQNQSHHIYHEFRRTRNREFKSKRGATVSEVLQIRWINLADHSLEIWIVNFKKVV